ncbi:uncharacterized protein LOC21394334 [Morus notabilis]|nr:uncharacterized protein LOC21394334 [Morus notabilis]
MMASKLSYENKARIEHTVTQLWKMQFLGFYEYWNDFQEKSTTQAFMMRDKSEDHDTIVVAFRGTLPFDVAAWCSDFDISWYRIPKVGKVHGGFMKALGLQKSAGFPKDMIEEEEGRVKRNRPSPLAYYDIREKLRELLGQNDKAKYVLTGHSLGGALAILFLAGLTLHEEKFLLERLEGVYTFGQPRVGDEKFGEFMKKEIIENDHTRYFRFVYCNDIVPRLPYDYKPLMFKHFGTCLHSDRHYKVKIADDEPSKYYFSRRKAITMRINSVLELIRSFTIAYTKGPEFKEGKLMRLLRVIGLVIPGLAAHSPQDYINTTRLASKEVFLPPKNSSQKNPIIGG